MIRIFTKTNAPALPEASGILIRVFIKTNAPSAGVQYTGTDIQYKAHGHHRGQSGSGGSFCPVFSRENGRVGTADSLSFACCIPQERGKEKRTGCAIPATFSQGPGLQGLRAAGEAVLATPRGYLMERAEGVGLTDFIRTRKGLGYQIE